MITDHNRYVCCPTTASVEPGPARSPRVGLVVAIGAISTGAILVRWSAAPAAVAAFYRVLFTTLPLAAVAVWRYRDAFGAIHRRDAIGAALAGLALAIHFASWFESLAWTSVAASVTLVQSQPLFVALGSWLFLRERLTRPIIGGILLAVGGVVVISVGDLLGGSVGSNPALGNALALIGALAAAGYVLAGRSLRQRVPLIPYVVVVYTVAAAGLLVIALLDGAPLLGYPTREWLLFVGLAVGPGLLGHTVINWALGHLNSSLVSVSLLGEPVGAAILAAVLLDEQPALATIVGGGIVLAGIVLTARGATG